MRPRSALLVLALQAQNLLWGRTSSFAEKLWHEQGLVEGQDTAPDAPLVERGGTEQSLRHCCTVVPVAHPGSQENDEPARLPLGLLLILAESERHVIVLPTKVDGSPHDRAGG